MTAIAATTMKLLKFLQRIIHERIGFEDGGGRTGNGHHRNFLDKNNFPYPISNRLYVVSHFEVCIMHVFLKTGTRYYEQTTAETTFAFSGINFLVLLEPRGRFK
jgi:hypothetical protein